MTIKQIADACKVTPRKIHGRHGIPAIYFEDDVSKMLRYVVIKTIKVTEIEANERRYLEDDEIEAIVNQILGEE